jgi:hypothetical protein
VALATDYPEVTMGPLRVSFVGANGTLRTGDLWSTNRLDDPVIGGIVCSISDATTAMGLGDAMAAIAHGTSEEALIHVANALRGQPVCADATLIMEDTTGRTVRAFGDETDQAVLTASNDGPWITATETGIRQLHPSFEVLPPAVAEPAAAVGYRACWVEPLPRMEPTRPASLVLWRRRPGNPSPNQLRSISQAAAIAAVALSREHLTETQLADQLD